MNPPTYTLTITEADLDAAIAARGSDCGRARYCLLAQAVTRQEGEVTRFGYGFRRGLTYYTAQGTPARELISLFDGGTPEGDTMLRARLPMTVKLLATED